MERIGLEQLKQHYPAPDRERAFGLLRQELERDGRKIVVLDDDPTGVQTVHDVTVVTDWSEESIRAGFSTGEKAFFILTNSRSFTEEQTRLAHREIALQVWETARALGKDFLLVSRGDSTLRGHYPLETQVLRQTLEQQGCGPFDGEVICPFFPEGGRYTAENIHYVKEQDALVPCGETEFAKDKTFGYRSSHLGEWVAEKTGGEYPAAGCVFISLSDLRGVEINRITQQLCQVTGFGKVIVNALDYSDLAVFCAALYRALAQGKRFLFRTAAAFVKVAAGVTDKALLSREELVDPAGVPGGLVVAGSHTKKTTAQLAALHTLPQVENVEFNQHLVVQPEEVFQAEIDRVIAQCGRLLKEGKTVSVCTRRERLDINTGNREDELRISVKISDAVTAIVKGLSVRPAFLIAKGGITSSDIGTKALRVKRARVAGQVKPGIPVWLCGEESKFPGLPYVIFPGNVGEETTLKEIVEELARRG